MRLTQFRRLMADEFGQVRAEMLASDHIMASLGGRSANAALEEGVNPKRVWIALCEEFDVPAERR